MEISCWATTRRSVALPCRCFAAAIVACLLPVAAFADQYLGLTLTEAFERLEKAGLSILYSSDVVKPWMRVDTQPLAVEPLAILQEILRPHGIAVSDGPGEALLLVRARQRSPVAPGPAGPPATAPDIAQIIVSASQYELLREPIRPVMSLSAADLRVSPDLGDDPLRAVGRLPGTAGSDFTAKTNVRGGEVDETLVRFHGLRLYNPFHFKDFQSVFSTIDPGVVSGIDVYTGGYPAAFGDRMSGVIDIAPLRPKAETYRELSLSFFNAAVLGSGQFNADNGDWLVSVRRGNPDLLIEARNADIGRPSYFDTYARIGHRLTDTTRVSANVLLFEDDITLFDTDREEQAQAEYRDAYLWLRMDYDSGEALRGSVLLAHSDLDSDRSGRAEQPGVSRGMLEDRRSFRVSSVQHDWSWRLDEDLLLQFGGELRRSTGEYEYRDEAEFDIVFDLPEVASAPVRTRSVSARPEGEQFAAYASVRFEPFDSAVMDTGVRWDRETLSSEHADQVSPRLGILYRASDALSLRASWGRYFQAQAINELQVPDGVTEIFPAQRSRHLVVSGEYRHSTGLELRVEAYRKDYRELRPRFENLLNTFVLLPELKPDRIRIAPERATAKGVELTLRRQQGGSLGWWVSYSWSQVMDETAGVETPRSWDQQHSGGGGIAWQTPHWELSLGAKYHTGWPTTDLELEATEPPAVVVTGPRNARRQKNYATLDARAARIFEFEDAGTLTLFAELSNAFSRTNPCCIEYGVETDDPPGEPTLEVEQVEALPLVPSLGFVWRF